ncbi:MAG TPA: trigger factor [Candidatus Saccharimonadales bacterium]|nr:trigger factor [Candidatus Saccharimonadales bacterium]
MQITKKKLSATKVQLTLVADAPELQKAKDAVLRELGADLKIQGFRDGKAPQAIIEKHLDPTRLQSEFLDHVVNKLYVAALDQEKLRPVEQPQIKLTKFVPFDTVEVDAEVEVVGDITLPDYKKTKLAKEKVSVTAKDVDAVIADLRRREAERKEVTRAAKNGDQVTLDFAGVDAKTKEPIAGADGKDYPLTLGSNTFIPGFEPEVVGLKAGEQKTFTVTFPKDYGAKELQNRKVSFTVTIKKVDELVEPALDDALAVKIGPFKTVQELKDDIKKELVARAEQDTEQKYADDLITKLAEKTKVAIPAVLIDEQIDRLEKDQRQNLLYRGQTWQEYLETEGLTDKTYREKQRPAAELRVKAGLMLSAVAEAENISITQQEFSAYLQALKARYTDAQMQAELAKPEAQRELASRLLTEKTVAKLTGYASSK